LARPDEQRDFFVSYTQADRGWAEWLAWELEAAGYTALLQAWDMTAGTAFLSVMDRAVQAARHIVIVLSPAYLRSAMAAAEWRPAFVADPGGESRRLLPVRVEACAPKGLLADRVYIDLVGLDEAGARAKLLSDIAAALRGHSRPTTRPRFPATPSQTQEAAERPRFPTALPPVWNVPYLRNLSFTGRQEVLAALTAWLASSGAVAITQVLQGAGGVGKTALAAEYAYQQRASFDTVWWVRAEEPATLIGDYADMAASIGLHEAGEADQNLVVAAVRNWLEGHDRWLLILDNAQAPEAPTGLRAPLARLLEVLPRVPRGQVLVTTRDASWERYAPLTELDVFTPREANAFLLTRSGSGDEQAARAVSELLGWLPLALEQAGAYMRETRIPLATYLRRLREFPAVTLAKGHPRDRDPADTVSTTWQVSVEQVRPIRGAVELLEICAFLGPEEIPRDLFAQPLDPAPDELVALTADPFALDEAIAGLRRFGLVKADEQILTVHQLVQQVIRDGLDPEAAGRRAETAAQLLLAMFPTDGLVDSGGWPLCARLLPHVLTAVEYGEQHDVQPVAAASLLHRAASYLQGRARYAQAQELFERGLAIRETHLGANHPDTATSLNDLGLVLRAQGDLDPSRLLFERGLAIRETLLGADHPDTATSLDDLGLVLRAQGEFDRARALDERALAIRETHLGANHPDTATSLNNLAQALRDQGDLDTARALHERALAIRQARLGEDHPGTAQSLSNLGLIRGDQGDLDTARTLHERALAIRQARLGEDHPLTATSLSYLGLVLARQGDLGTARTLVQQALSIHEARLGEDHPLTATSLSYLGLVLAQQGDFDTARALHQRALTIRLARLGANHPHTVRSEQLLRQASAGNRQR
jgi:tetratricopeptide (TPR) repeat protein